MRRAAGEGRSPAGGGVRKVERERQMEVGGTDGVRGRAGSPGRRPSSLSRGASLSGLVWRRLRRNRLALAGAGFLLLLSTAVMVGPPVIRHTLGYEHDRIALAEMEEPPSLRHWAGTDDKGRDLLLRILKGGRLSLAIGLLAAGTATIIGVTYGAVAGYAGGRVGNAMMRLVDAMYGLPYMFLVIILVTYLGRSVLLLFVALGAVGWLTMARIVRGAGLRLRDSDFAEAARALGTRPISLIARHIVPNLLGPVVVYATLSVPRAMLQEAFLSFLGLGVQPPDASWGTLAKEGSEVMTGAIGGYAVQWWMVVFPSLALGLTLLALNFVGDGLRDALDPRTAPR